MSVKNGVGTLQGCQDFPLPVSSHREDCSFDLGRACCTSPKKHRTKPCSANARCSNTVATSFGCTIAASRQLSADFWIGVPQQRPISRRELAWNNLDAELILTAAAPQSVPRPSARHTPVSLVRRPDPPLDRALIASLFEVIGDRSGSGCGNDSSASPIRR